VDAQENEPANHASVEPSRGSHPLFSDHYLC